MLLISGGHEANGCGDIRPLSPNLRGRGPWCKRPTGAFRPVWDYSRGTMTTISVVIPTRNDAGMLAACLAALAAQTRPADEIVVVDNASTDNTAEVCAAAGARRLAVELPGIAACTAHGFDEAGSELIARLDTDSVPPADWLERVEAILEEAGPLSAVSGPGDFYGENRFARWVGESVYIPGYFWAIGWLLGHPPLFGSNFAMRSEVWDRIRGSVHRGVPPVHDDLDISYQIPPDVKVILTPRCACGSPHGRSRTGIPSGAGCRWRGPRSASNSGKRDPSGGAGAGGNGNATPRVRRIRKARSGPGSSGTARSHWGCARPGRPRSARRWTLRSGGATPAARDHVRRR